MKKESPYGKTTIWLRKDIMYVTKMRHFSKQGDPLKEIHWKSPKKLKGKAYRGTTIELTDVKRKHRTTLVTGPRTLTPPKKLDGDTFTVTTLTRLVD